MKKIELERLSDALIKARDAALSVSNCEDYGSCNFDTPMLLGIKMTQAQAESLPVKVRKITYGFWKGAWMVYVPLYGMAMRRTTMAEAASKSLEESGYDSCVYYQLD